MIRIQPKKNKKYPWYVRILFWLQRRKYGKELESSKIWARSPSVFLGLSAFFGSLERKRSPLSPQLRALVTVRVSHVNHCKFCVDLNSARLLSLGESEEKLQELPKFQESELFTEKEKVALEYSDAITYTDQEITDALFPRLQKHFSDDEIVELTGLIAFQNCSSKFNSALGIPPQGFCVIQPKNRNRSGIGQ
ncbi:MAG: carboxymuconolactone decarboxylase family protein [Waddliaceae bacterium]